MLLAVHIYMYTVAVTFWSFCMFISGLVVCEWRLSDVIMITCSWFCDVLRHHGGPLLTWLWSSFLDTVPFLVLQIGVISK